MVIGRRQFSKILISLMVCQKSFAYSLSKLLGHPNKEYVQAYLQRFWKWYNEEWASLENKMSNTEKALFKNAMQSLTTFETKISEDLYLERFMVRHQWIQKKQHSSKYSIAPTHWPEPLKKQWRLFAREFMSEKQWLEVKDLDIYGWSHDFDQSQIKVFHSLNSKNHESLLQVIVFHLNDKTKTRGTISFHQKLPHEAHNFLDSKTLISGFKVSYENGQTEWKLRTKSTFLMPLGNKVMRVAALHKKQFHQLPNLIDVGGKNSSRVKLYYP